MPETRAFFSPSSTLNRTHKYDGVLLLGDSMGGSAALRYASLAASAIRGPVRAVAFVPQVNLVDDEHCCRDDFAINARRRFQRMLTQSVKKATANAQRRKRRGRWFQGPWWRRDAAATVVIHRGTNNRDTEHALLVSAHSSALTTNTTAKVWRRSPPSASSGGVVVVEHSDCAGHLLTAQLKRRGELDELIELEMGRVAAAAAALLAAVS